MSLCGLQDIHCTSKLSRGCGQSRICYTVGTDKSLDERVTCRSVPHMRDSIVSVIINWQLCIYNCGPGQTYLGKIYAQKMNMSRNKRSPSLL